MADQPMSGDRAGYNPDCDTCTYAWCCGRCYCCHPSPMFEIRKVDPAPRCDPCRLFQHDLCKGHPPCQCPAWDHLGFHRVY